MPRLAWFTPAAKSRSGIAAYNDELLPLLADRYAIEVFTSPLEAGHRRSAAHPPAFEAHDFPWRHFTSAYDLVVYQMGNSTCHAFMWPYLFRHPGLVVLHDGQLHHSRAGALLSRGRAEDYRAEFCANHPEAPEDLPELFIRGLADSVYYLWPMLRLVVQHSRLAAVHAPRLAEQLTAEFGTEVAAIRMGVADPRVPPHDRGPGEDPVARRGALRARLGLSPESVVFAAFGMVTPEKRISQVLAAMPAVARVAPTVHLVLVGSAAEHYDALAEARGLGVADRVTVTGWVADEEVPDYLAVADACLCLRWPTGRETSASWLRALAAGRPTIVTNLAHTDEVAYYDPRTWTVEPAGSGDAAFEPARRAACVGIDLLDERHSIVLAMSRLAVDEPLRSQLGDAARAHWEQHHTLGCMVDDYHRALARALARSPGRRSPLPPHLDADGTGLARRIASEFGVDIDVLRPRSA